MKRPPRRIAALSPPPARPSLGKSPSSKGPTLLSAHPNYSPLPAALPFWASLGIAALAVLGAWVGGLAVLLPILATWYLVPILDLIAGRNRQNPDPATDDGALFWYRLVTLVWPAVQFGLIFGLLWYVPQGALTGWEVFGLTLSVGVLSGAIGIVYAHELMHQPGAAERWLGDALMAMVLYSHFRSEHLLVHHRHVGTPRDAVTAPMGEGFHRFFLRVLPQSAGSAFRAEAGLLAKRGLPWWARRNPFWRYGALQLGFLALAIVLAGPLGLVLFAFQAFIAIWQLELINYIEHYGLTRRRLEDGSYEPVRPHHSWNGEQRASNWLLINLQRHADHHKRPDRRFPLLQTYPRNEAPDLPYGYGVMGFLAMIPPLWRWRMDPRVKAWRKRHYPDITEWRPYSRNGWWD